MVVCSINPDFINREAFWEHVTIIFSFSFLIFSMRSVDDGVHVLYVNGEYRGNDDMGKLMEDFNNPEPESMNYEVIKMRSIYLKEEEKGVAGMCAFSEELLAKGDLQTEVNRI